ncbi:MAG: hypothetical protein WC323_03510 [Patescibacteria group bacterium]|jgi:hypothetical protein
MKKITMDNTGISVMMSIIILTSILIVALGVSEILSKSLQTSRISSRSSIAYLVAETGAERLLYMAKNNLISESDFEIGCLNDYIDLDNAICDTNKKHYIDPDNADYYYKVKYSKEADTGYHVFTLIGFFYNTRRSIEIKYAK